MFGSNDYLGLITHPKVKEAAAQAVRKYGSGCSGSRLLNGTLDMHVKLEAELAAFVHKEAAIIFGTGFQANYATLSALCEKGDVMICDHNLHASLVEGALRSPARTMRFRHNDLEHFERCLENCPPDEKIFIVSEGVFSMEGDIADLRGILKLSKPYDARVYVDEAHGIGVLGPTGAGAAEHLGVLDEVDIVMGTFSQVAGVGGRLRRVGTRRDRLPQAHRAALRLFRQFAPGFGCGDGRGPGDSQEGAGAAPPPAAHRAVAARRAARPRICRAAGRNGHRSSGDSGRAGFVPPLQGPARRRASTSTRCCAPRPRRTCCASRARQRTPKATFSGSSRRWIAWPKSWASSGRLAAASQCASSKGRRPHAPREPCIHWRRG